MRYINLEYHPMDSRITMVDDDICQTLNTRMGTGGGNVPLVLVIDGSDGMDSRPPNSEDSLGGAGAMYTVNSRDYKGVMIVVLSEDYRSADGEQPSGQLLRTGCIQRYVCDGEEECGA